MTVPLVLASGSPRRRELLALLGLSCTVVSADVDESWIPGESPTTHAERLARTKASAVRASEAAVVAADTIVVIDGDILGKPKDAADAARMLRRLSGREHTVHTALAVAYAGRTESAVGSTQVWFRPLSEQTIADYVASGEPMDKAGAYGVQGFGAVIVERIAGDYFTVMGLGLGLLVALWRRVGLDYRFGTLVPALPRA